MTLDPERLRKAMVKKGFIAEEGGNHTRYVLRYSTPGKPPIATVLSRGGHGKKDIGPSMESRIKRELGFDTADQLRLYTECRLSEEEYVNLLKRKGLLNRKHKRRRNLQNPRKPL